MMIFSVFSPGIFPVRQAQAGPPAKINICHKNGDSGTWNALNIDKDAWDEHSSAHSDHEDDYVYAGPTKEDGKPTKEGDDWCANNTPQDDPQEIPSINLTKTVVYNSEKQSASYTINWSVSGAAVDSFIITDTLPSWTDGVVGTISPTPDPVLLSGDLNFDSNNPTGNRIIVWDLGAKESGTNGQITFKVELLAKETCEIAPNKVSATGTYSEGEVSTGDVFSEDIDVNDAHCEDPEDPEEPEEPKDDPENSCLVPDMLEGEKINEFGLSLDGPEKSLQNILNNASYTINTTAVGNDTGYQAWNVPIGVTSVTFTATKIASIAGYTNTLGYYVDDLTSIVPVVYGVPTAIDTTSAFSIGFVLISDTGSVINNFATEKLLNPGGDDHAVVYNPEDNTYVIAFEDISPIGSSDNDYNDLVVEVTIDSCTEAVLVCEETQGSIVSDENDTVTFVDVNGVTSIPNTSAIPVSVVPAIQALGSGVWTADVLDANARWIWSEDPYDADWQVNKWVTFTKNFTIVGDPQSANLNIGSDNSYEVWINGDLVGFDATENNHSTADVISIPTSSLNNGSNTLEIRVKNWKLPNGAKEHNPGGLIYNLSWTAEDCGDNPPHDDPDPDPEHTSELIVVNPDDMKGWAFAQETATGSGSMVTGPVTTPLGVGSANLVVDSTGGEILGVAYPETRLDAVTDLEYSTYRTSGGPALAIALQFNIDADLTDANTAWQGRLVYEPYHTQTVTSGGWETWDPMNDSAGTGTGNWWFSNGALAAGPGLCAQATPCTFTEVKSAYPNAGIHATLGGIIFKAGGGWAGGFDGNVDEFVIIVKTIGLNTHTTTYDFEPVPTNDDGDGDGDGGGDGDDSSDQTEEEERSTRVRGVAGASSSNGGGDDDGEVLGATIEELPGLPNTGNGAQSQTLMITLSLILALIAVNTVGLKLSKRN